MSCLFFLLLINEVAESLLINISLLLLCLKSKKKRKAPCSHFFKFNLFDYFVCLFRYIFKKWVEFNATLLQMSVQAYWLVRMIPLPSCAVLGVPLTPKTPNFRGHRRCTGKGRGRVQCAKWSPCTGRPLMGLLDEPYPFFLPLPFMSLSCLPQCFPF